MTLLFAPPSSSTSINSLHTADLICNTRLSTSRRLFVRIPTARYLSILDYDYNEYPTVPTSNNRSRPTAHPSIDPSAIRRTNTRKRGRRVLHLHLHLKTHSTEYTPLLRNTKKLPQDQTTQTALALRGQTIQRPTRLSPYISPRTRLNPSHEVLIDRTSESRPSQSSLDLSRDHHPATV